MSGKSTLRSQRKHQRRRHNDIAHVRNFLNTLQSVQYDRNWLNLVCKMFNVETTTTWNNKYQKTVRIPAWFWYKIDRIMRENHIPRCKTNTGITVYTYEGGVSRVGEVVFSTDKSVLMLARLLEIEIHARGMTLVLPVLNRCRNRRNTELRTKMVHPKPENIHYATTEEIDIMRDNINVDKMLKEIPALESRIGVLSRELVQLQDKLQNTRQDVRDYLSKKYGI
ncbi:hypothetical protein FDI46_gp177 [Aeromonas phage AS-gz]|uniref:Uncharacterized protein n=1 Tax=Aeromonas phage AS-gz TaxID=2026082 RepID=A0A223LFD5_9CAUD|nr:hypothetical protein FDI46_gp177 [Aeromonas phage AS-gz]ASU00713.1 hypothetical protein [Aeromonas phage AS-gz]